MNVELLERKYTEAVTQYQTMKSRNVDEGTLKAAAREAVLIKERLDRAKADAGMTSAIERITGGLSMPHTHVGGSSIGAQFVNSDTYRWLKDTKNSRAGNWTSPASELMAATLTEDAASGGDLAITDSRPGISPCRRDEPLSPISSGLA